MKNNHQQMVLCALVALSLAGTATAQRYDNDNSITINSNLDTIIKKQYVSVAVRESKIPVTEPLSKEVSAEVAMPKNGEIYIQNNYRSVQVKTWDQQKVKLTTTAYYYDKDNTPTDEELLDKANISLKVMGSSVKIKSGIGNNYGYGFAYSSCNNCAETMTSGSGSAGQITSIRLHSNSTKKNSSKSDLIIYMPAGTKIDIENKYGNVMLFNGITEASIDISNGNLEVGDINKLILRSKYANANLGNLKNAEVELMNGRFSAQNIDQLDIDSKYSNIELAAVKNLSIRSNVDEYDVEEVGELRGRKNYGNLRITHLKESLELEGQNADLKIKDVAASVNRVKIDDKYADIRIPLRNIKAFSIDFSGAYSTVYGDFEKKPVVEEKAAKEPKENTTTGTEKPVTGYAASSDTKNQQFRINLVQVGAWGGGNDTPSKFTAAVGDGKGMKVDMKCQNCTVDFK